MPMGSERETTAEARPRGVSLIILYKLTKAVAQLMLAALVAVLTSFGLADRVQSVAAEVRERFTGVWSHQLARLLVSASNHLWLVVFALAFDGVLSSLEGWALFRGFRWAPWLVVLATSALLPFEVVELVRAVRPTRLLALVVNVAIVLYLGRRALLHMREAHRSHRHGAGANGS